MTLCSFIFFFIFIVVRNSGAVDGGQCLDNQKKLLVELKSELIFNSSQSQNLVMWNETETDDCCHWKGVECDGGVRVIGLHLVSEGISCGIGESSTLFRFRYLSELGLSLNDLHTNQILRNIHRLTNLRNLHLSDAGLMGPIPSTFANLTHLLHLDLSHNFLTASIPSFHMCNKLQRIDLGYNNLVGSVSHLDFEALTNLSYLDLSFNSLRGTIPHHLFALPSINTLSLSYNQFSGEIKEFPIVNHSKLCIIDLSSNRIQGPIPNFFFQLRNVTSLWLSDNLFDGIFQLQKIQSLPRLTELALSYNNLSVETTNMNSSLYGFPQLAKLHLSSCNLFDFPDLRNQSYLWDLDLSNNRIGGDIPRWIWEIGIHSLNLSLNLLTDLQKPYQIPATLYLLDLHSNQLRCEFHLFPQSIYWGTFFSVANNSLTGVVPSSICNVSNQFEVLDLSFNNLSGTIPTCLLKNNMVGVVLNLRGNNINGVIPDQFHNECGLTTFDVSDNNLGGKIPKSLANCKDLVVMNVGNNNFDDTFPCMLPLSLRVLVLRSNRFHGELRCHRSWPNLQILDVSSNNFSGTLNPLNFSSWKGMVLESLQHLRPNRSDSKFLGADYYYRDDVSIAVKGVEVNLVKIWADFTSIDLSSNNFQGDIPDAIGHLTSLYLLDLSHNALTGTIPKSLAALAELGSLDLSANHLRGRIPEELAKLTFLSIFNVSHNNLTGMIPSGPQFQTFPADSFEGNTGLCGFPLNRSCSDPRGSGSTPSKSKDDEEIWDYVFGAVGYVVGLGSIAWTLLRCRSFRQRYFEKIDEVVDKIYVRRERRRRGERIRRRRRRVERRNEVRRH